MIHLPSLLGAIASAALGSVFAAANGAVSAIPRRRLLALIDQSSETERYHLERFLNDAVTILTRWLTGRVLCSALTAVLAADAIRGVPLGLRWLAGLAGALLLYGSSAQVAVVVGRSRARLVAPTMLRLLRPIELLLSPFSLPLELLGKLAGSRPPPHLDLEEEAKVTESEVEYLVEDAKRRGALEAEPAAMIQNVLDFKELMVRDVMVPRIKMVAIDADAPVEEVLNQLASLGHSRYPVYRSTVDEMVGILYTKDIFRHSQRETLESEAIDTIVRSPIHFVPETRLASSVLADMRKRRQHMAIALDEFGGVAGLVTLEDILEEIVGDIQDEYDSEEAPIVDLGGGVLLAEASVSLTDLSAFLGRTIAGDGDYGSLGGLLLHEAGRVPAKGTRIAYAGLEFVIRESDAKHISKVEILLPPPSTGRPDQKPPTLSVPPPGYQGDAP